MSQILAQPPLSPREPWSVWVMGASQSQRSAQGSTTALEPLNAPPEQWPAAQEVVLMVPASMLSWHCLTLPRLPAHRWKQALAGLLEDQLLADPDSIHLALAPNAQAGSPTCVAACDKAWLQESLQVLHAAGRSAHRIVPEFEPGDPAWLLVGQSESPQWVQIDPQGVQVLPLAEPARESLLSWIRATGDHGATVWAEPALAQMAQQALDRPAGLLPTAQRLRHALESAWNLAQFDLASTGTDRWRQRSASAWRAWLQAPAWRPLRWGLLALVLVQFVGIQAWSWRQSELSKNQQETLKSILRSTFPQVTVVIDPLAQMQREVKALGQASGIGLPGDLGVMLSALADVGAMSPRRLEYAGGQLQLSPWPLEPSEAAQVQAALALRGYQLEGAGEQWQMRVKSP